MKGGQNLPGHVAGTACGSHTHDGFHMNEMHRDVLRPGPVGQTVLARYPSATLYLIERQELIATP